jgi:hypothetical protein
MMIFSLEKETVASTAEDSDTKKDPPVAAGDGNRNQQQ